MDFFYLIIKTFITYMYIYNFSTDLLCDGVLYYCSCPFIVLLVC